MEELASLSVNEDEHEEEINIKIKQEKIEPMETDDMTIDHKSIPKTILNDII